jgi:hypothetical protein
MLGLVDEAGRLYDAVAAGLGPGVRHAELAARRAALAAEAGDAAEAARLRAEAATALTAPLRPVGAAFGRRVALDGVALGPGPVAPGDVVEARYRWRLLGPTRRPLTATVHLRGERHRFGDDHRLPPWIPGLAEGAAGPQHLLIERRVTVPPGTPPGTYRVVVGVWDPSTGTTLRRFWRGLVPTLEATVEVGAVQVHGPTPAARPAP